MYKWIIFVLIMGTLGYIMANVDESSTEHEADPEVGMSLYVIGIILALVCVIVGAATSVFTRVLWDVNPLRLIFFNLMTLMPIYIVYALLSWTPENPCRLGEYNTSEWLLIIADVLLGFFAILAATRGG
jgi:drug/metabolite transporter (DMT)-like permease